MPQTQASATLQALQDQVTSPAMYSWLVQVLGGAYRYFLQQATAVAQLAQAQLAFDRAEPYRRAALIVDKILKGAKPADLPVEQPTKFELMINLKTAKVLRLTIPPVVMMRAEKVIK